MSSPSDLLATGIAPFDERVGGLEPGGSYLVVGAPGPEKMVAALQFLHAGIQDGEPGLLVSNADVDGLLSVAVAWGFDFWDAWESGGLQIVGFKDDFELRAMRSIAPEEVVEELDEIKGVGLARIAVDPGAMFLSGGARTLLGSTYLSWARRQSATVLTTFSVDGGATSLPSSADWLTHATTGRLLLEKRNNGLYQISLSRSVPEAGQREETISLQLKPREGLILPESYPSRRGADRGQIDEHRLLLVSLGGEHASDLESWATRAFETDVVSEPFEAVAKVQAGSRYGGVLIHSPRQRIREAIQACRAVRPLSRAAIVFASDDAVRSTDRVQILEAGADDCLTGGLDFRELGLRIKQSISNGAKPAAESGVGQSTETLELIPEDSDEGRVSVQTFISEVERRGGSADHAFFCVLDVTSQVLNAGELQEALAAQIRHEEGDIVTGGGNRAAVLLQGAREGQIGPFLERLRSKINERASDHDARVTMDVLSHPSDVDRIMEILRTVRGDDS